jgi:hypothetical protein
MRRYFQTNPVQRAKNRTRALHNARKRALALAIVRELGLEI